MAPRQLTVLRSNSTNRSQRPAQFSARPTAVQLADGQLSCGASLGCCVWTPRWLQRFASHRIFVVLLATCALLHAAELGILSANSKALRLKLGLSQEQLEILILSSDLVQALVAVFFARLVKNSRPQFLGALVITHAAACCLVAVPNKLICSQPFVTLNNHNDLLCKTNGIFPSGPRFCITAFIFVLVLQICRGLLGASTIVHGLIYLDDNVLSTKAPVLIGVTLGISQLGYKVGHVFAYVTQENADSWWIGWAILAVIYLVAGSCLVLFPARLPDAAIRKAADDILREACSNGKVVISERREVFRDPINPGCLPSLARVFTNKVALLKILALIFLYICMENFDSFKDKYLESIFHIPLPSDLFQDTWISRVTTGLLEPLVVCLSVLLSALVVAWRKPRASSLAWWSAGVAFFCGIVAMGHLQLTCHDLAIMGEKVGNVASFKLHDCDCPQDQDFWPVCMGFPPQTFYSPCHAGCKNYSAGVFRNCRYENVKEGSCGSEACVPQWVALQALWVLSSTLISSAIVPGLLLIIRSVDPEDKSLVLAVQLFLVGITSNLPSRYLFKAITGASCEHWSSDSHTCKLHHSRELSIHITIFLAVFLLISSFFEVCTAIAARNVSVFDFSTDLDSKVTLRNDKDRQKLLKRRATPLPRRRRNDVEDEQHGFSEEDLVEPEDLPHLANGRVRYISTSL